jgi:hypothetical protein
MQNQTYMYIDLNSCDVREKNMYKFGIVEILWFLKYVWLNFIRIKFYLIKLATNF